MTNYIIKPESYYDNAEARLSKHACTVPFRHIEIHRDGGVTICCHTWLPTWAGNLLTQSAEEVLNNTERIRIQKNMREGNFSDCNDICPQLSSFLHKSDRKFHWAIVPIDNLDKAISHQSIDVYFSYDPSCNLQCPSCRDNLIVWHPDDPEDAEGQQLLKIHNNVKALIALLVEQNPTKKIVLSITGSGDPFASPLYWGYLVELCQSPIPKNLQITLQTNGVMMTKENWEHIKPLWPHIHYVNVSVDAATEETYKIVRKNGSFKKLQKNLLVLDDMIVNKCFPNLASWQCNMVVQKANYKELKPFTEWMLTFKSQPEIWTNLIAQWWHISDTKFKTMAIWQDNNPGKAELIEILKDPVFQNRKVRLGNLSSFTPSK